MAGTVVDGELTGAAVSGSSRYALATPVDDVAIRRLLRSNPMRGTISLSFEREPDYFRGAQLAGAADQTIVAYDRDRLVCMGRCTIRQCWLDGKIRRVGYLGELRLDASAATRVDILRAGYRFFHELQRRDPPDFQFTSIAADNLRARRLLECGLRGFPRYTFMADFVTVVIQTKDRHPLSHLLQQRGRTLLQRRVKDNPPCLQSATADEIVEFLNRKGRCTNLAAVWTPERLLGLSSHGLPLDRIRVQRVGGRIVACAALWDQRSFRQTVIRDYSPVLRWTRPLYNVAATWLRQPRLPPPNATLSHGLVSPLALAASGEAMLPDFLRALVALAAQVGLEYVTLGFAADDPRLELVRKNFASRSYPSRLYRVTWPGEPEPLLPASPIRPEIAFL